jgi:hypothetical protein
LGRLDSALLLELGFEWIHHNCIYR